MHAKTTEAARKPFGEIMRTIKGQVIASTNEDSEGHKFTKADLERFLEQLPETWPMNDEHDLSRPPIGRAYNKRLSQLDDGEWAIRVDVDIEDEERMPQSGGFSIAILGPVVAGDPERSADVEIQYNARVFPSEAIEGLASLSDGTTTIHIRQVIQKGVLAPVILVLKFAVAAAATGFLAKMGSDAWTALKNRLRSIGERRRLEMQERLLCHVRFEIETPQGRCLVSFEAEAERLGEYSGFERALEQMRMIDNGRPPARISFASDSTGSCWLVRFYETRDGRIVSPDSEDAGAA